MVISCQVERLARKTAKIGLSAINSFKKKALHLMGCLCSKGAKDDNATSGHRTPSRRDDSTVAASAKTSVVTNDGSNAKFKENTFNSSTFDSYGGVKVVALDARISSGNNTDLKDVASWPAWLINVAPKAVEGWLPRRADSFEKLGKIGQGTYSIVYKARDIESGKIVALKKVRFFNMDPESVRFMAREIHILRKLDHPNVIKLEGIVTSRVSQSLYLVFEYMEHDLAGLVATPGLKLTEPQIGDFGLAISYDPNNPQPLTSRVVTLWYRPPELLLGATEYGVAVDMWSTGCIVGELFAGKPIMPGRTEVEQIHKIFKLCGSPPECYCKKSKVPQTAMFKPQQQYRRCVAETFKDFPPSAVVLIDSLLSLEPEVRGTAASALQSDHLCYVSNHFQFFRTKPLACDPSSLPKLPPSKEYDVRLRQEEARRQRDAALSGGAESVRPENGNHVTSRAIDIAALVKVRHSPTLPAFVTLQQQPTHTTSKSTCEKFNTEDSVPGFRVEPRALPTSVQVPECGSTWNNMGGYTHHHAVPGRVCSSVRVARKKGSSHSNIPQYDPTDLRNGSEITYHDQPADRPASSHKKDLQENRGRKYKRIHYSGPLMPPGGNIEDMLKEHERHIQEAVRKARLGKVSR
ncbi:hypothetical protein HU200_059505 [Digitaria exilis]|uniref:[RNA-polymerase]-subunit kinase n=1 Tax=Digitaria exilis TaxID=1010633 RepID=A0A835E312_9POAL|nr:hypothetical protein HU200_059505 [Digitaria exilis]